MFNTHKFLREHSIVHSTDHHHARPGWIAIKSCPFCPSRNYHFGMETSSGGCNCWKCGKHSLTDTIMRLCNVDFKNAKDILRAYSDKQSARARQTHLKASDTVIERPGACQLPRCTQILSNIHIKYLTERNFDAEKLKRLWNLQGTNMIFGTREEQAFSMRIIIPITYKNTIVSYQGRDITGNEDRLRYLTCSKKNETRFHKHCLYGLDAIRGDSIVITEGVTKVWRLGQGAVATFGIMWTDVQALLIVNSGIKNAFVLFDKGEQAQTKAEELANLLALYIDHTEIINPLLFKDPGDLLQDEADNLMKNLIRR